MSASYRFPGSSSTMTKPTPQSTVRMRNTTPSLANLTSYGAVVGVFHNTSCTLPSHILTTAPQDTVDSDDNPQVIEAAWNSELYYRVSVFDGDSVEEFLDLFVACSQSYTSVGDLDGVFADYQPRRGEMASYSALVCNDIYCSPITD